MHRRQKFWSLTSVRPYAAPQENQCECKAVLTTAFVSGEVASPTALKEKQKEIWKALKYNVNLCIHYTGQQREKEQDD